MPLPAPVAVAAVLLGAVAGGLAGVLTRHWLRWLRRGAHVPGHWCALGLGGLWSGAVAAWVAGALPVAALPLTVGLGWLVVAGSAIDVAVHRLPDALTVPAAPVVLVLLVPLGVDAATRGALAGLVLCAAHAVVRLVAPAAMGGGDVKLAAAVGAALGGMSWSALVVGTVLAGVLTALAGALRLGIAAQRDPASPAPGPSGATRPGTARRGAAPAGSSPHAAEQAGSIRPGAAPPEVAASEATRVGAVPHGPSMMLACLVVVGIASTGPAVPVPEVQPAGCPIADMTAQASPWPGSGARVRG